MLIFLDTEFTDFDDCELVSIGLVTEEGRHAFYAESAEFSLDRCSPFVHERVLPLLSPDPSTRRTRPAITADLWQWFAALPSGLTIAYDYPMDWTLLLGILLENGRPHPPGNIVGTWFLRDTMDDPDYKRGMARYYSRGHARHHALHDAWAHRAGLVEWQLVRQCDAVGSLEPS